MKILVAIGANSSIVFVSKAYGSAISAKRLTNDCKYLDSIDRLIQFINV